jgi:hypothetical protein
MGLERTQTIVHSEQASPSAMASESPLSQRERTRNMIIYAANVCLIFTAAPVIYIGIVQAVLCQKLGASITVANLPTSLYLAVAALPVLFAWYLPYVRLLRRVVVTGYATMSCMGALVTALLVLPVSNGTKVAAVVLHGAVMGGTIGVVNAFEWEVLIRGVPESLRGKTFSLALGVGPIMAVIGSICSQMVLNGKIGNVTLGHLVFPKNFAVLYAATVPAIGLAALQSSQYVIPQPSVENVRQPFLSEVVGGFGEFVRDRLILIASMSFIILYAGQVIMPNMTLFTHEAMGEAAERYVGYQDGLRFAFKVAAGFLLGWLLTHTNVKLTLLITALFSLLGVVCVLALRGKWFLLGFGLLGAGELAYAYYSYYVLCCSDESKLRRNMAFFSMIQVPLAFVPDMYGRISDFFGLRLSFWVALFFIVSATVLALWGLPPHPRPASARS